MKVTRVQIVARGLTNRCPNCGSRTLFKSGTLFELNKQCSSCGFRFERDNDEGFFLGSLSLNYGVTLVCFLVPVMLLAFFKQPKPPERIVKLPIELTVRQSS